MAQPEGTMLVSKEMHFGRMGRWIGGPSGSLYKFIIALCSVPHLYSAEWSLLHVSLMKAGGRESDGDGAPCGPLLINCSPLGFKVHPTRSGIFIHFVLFPQHLTRAWPRISTPKYFLGK